jgi:hypothetical protein
MKARITIEYLEPAPDETVQAPIVLEFDDLHIFQSRPVHPTFNQDLGGAVTFTPDRTTTTVLTGQKTVPERPSA